jgi:hypothetical protein
MNRNSPVPLWAVLSIVGIVLTASYILGPAGIPTPPLTPLATTPKPTPSAQTSVLISATAASPLITSPSSLPGATTSTRLIDTRGWKVYRNDKYGFEFSYPSDLILSYPSPHDFAITRLLLSDATGTRFIWVYITSPASIDKWNDYVTSSSCTERVCEPFTYLNCESGLTVCEENSFDGLYNVELRRRAVKTNGLERVELLTVTNLHSQDMPQSTSIEALVREGMLSAGDQEFLKVFEEVFATLRRDR